MNVSELAARLQAAPFALAIGRSAVLFPAIETVHVLALVIVVGTIAVVDFRLLGMPSHTDGVRRLTSDVLPFTWVAFGVALVSGFLMFASAAVKYWADWVFQIKMLSLVLAGLNMGFFHLMTWRNVHIWDLFMKTPVAARIAGGLSLFLWIAIVVLGRWVGFTTN